MIKKFGILIAGSVLFSAFGLFQLAQANPSFFIRANTIVCGAYTATTSPTYMTPGTATTTITFDTGCAAAGSTDSAILLAQFSASSTASVVNINYEYSQDNVDWYQSNLSTQATTSAVQSITTGQSLSWTFASSTPGLGNVTNTNRTSKAIEVRTPTRYVRAILTLPVGSFNGAVWGEFVAKRQAN